MPYIRSNGIRFAFDTFGSMLKPPIFLIHGLTGQRMIMDDLEKDLFIKSLAEDYFVISYDCRGHGQTDHPASFSLEDHGRDLLSLIDAFGYEKASVLGQSMGSYIALQAAVLAPEKIEKLILVTPKAYDDGKGSSVQRLMKEEGLDMGSASWEQMMQVVSKALWSPQVTKEKMLELDKMMAVRSENTVVLTPEEKAAVNRALVGFDLRRQLGNVSCQTLVISGTYDKINPPAFGKEIADGITSAEYVEFPGGHYLTGEFEEEYIRCVKEFLKK